MTYGLAVDCGTTSVCLALSCNSPTREVLGTCVLENPSRRFGADVLTRAFAAARNPAARKKLSTELWQTVAEGAEKLSAASGIARTDIRHVALVANPVLSHLILGLDAERMTAYPYTLSEHFGKTVDFPLSDYGFSPACTLYLGPLVSAFLGSDVLLGFLNTEETKTPHLYADLGTNGEMILKTEDGIFAASAAAGPAFEGGLVACGMRAERGAIREVTYENGVFVCRTVENAPARGICAAGLISLLVEAKRAGLIEENGFVPSETLEIAEGILLTTKEVRAVLLAKAAFFAASNALLRTAGVCACDTRLTLSGGIGEHLNRTLAAEFGLFPEALLQNGTAVCDGALSGALRALWDSEFQASAARTAREIRVIDLAADAHFQEEYISGIAL